MMMLYDDVFQRHLMIEVNTISNSLKFTTELPQIIIVNLSAFITRNDSRLNFRKKIKGFPLKCSMNFNPADK